MQKNGDPVLVAQRFVLCEALLPELFGERELAREVHRAPVRPERARTEPRRHCIRMLEERRIPMHALCREPQHPQLLEIDEQLEAELDLATLERPGQR